MEILGTQFCVKSNMTMKLNLLDSGFSTGGDACIRFPAAARFFGDQSVGGGVSMFQGASRGIGLEFETAKSVKDRYGSLNLLVNASGILSLPNVLQPVQRPH